MNSEAIILQTVENENSNICNDEKYHTITVKDLDELRRKAKAYDEMISIITGYGDDFEGYINYLRNCRDEMIG